MYLQENIEVEMHLQVNTLFDTKHCPLHMTYAPAKYKVATSNGLAGDAFTRKYSI